MVKSINNYISALVASSPIKSTHVLCNGDANGQIEITVNGGSAPYNISWTGAASGNPPGDEVNSSGGNYTMSGLIAGDYDITITDNNGCVLSLTDQTITQPAALAQTNVSTDVSCNGGSDGQIVVTATGGTAPYQVSWTGTAIGNPAGDEISLDGGDYTIGSLSNGNYVVTITDANNCQTSFNKLIFEPVLLTATISSFTNISCNGGSDGTATVDVAGGTLPYNYSWSNGQTLNGDITGTNSVNGLSQGNISITITDGNGCTATDNTNIIEPTSFNK